MYRVYKFFSTLLRVISMHFNFTKISHTIFHRVCILKWMFYRSRWNYKKVTAEIYRCFLRLLENCLRYVRFIAAGFQRCLRANSDGCASVSLNFRNSRIATSVRAHVPSSRCCDNYDGALLDDIKNSDNRRSDDEENRAALLLAVNQRLMSLPRQVS